MIERSKTSEKILQTNIKSACPAGHAFHIKDFWFVIVLNTEPIWKLKGTGKGP
jgi:hypothetical protein